MTWSIREGDVLDRLREMPDESVQCCVTSPPYWGLRDYGHAGQIGLEPTPSAFVTRLVEVFAEVHRVLRDDGTLWLNLGDSYAANQSNNGGYSDKSTLAGFSSPNTKGRIANESGLRRSLTHGVKPKDLVGIPWMVAFALRDYGWYLRSEIIWHKPNPMPESVTDRPTKAHEYVFLLSKSARYFYDAEAIREEAEYGRRSAFRGGAYVNQPRGQNNGRANAESPSVTGSDPSSGRNARTVWTINPQPTPEAHFATFPEALAERCIKAGSRPGDTVLDPFAGSGTTLLVAERLGRDSLGIELNPEYIAIAERRIKAHDPTATIELAPGVKQASLFTGDMP